MSAVAMDSASQTSARRDLLLVCLSAVLFWAASIAFELHERVVAWTAPWERYQLDELPGVLLFVSIALAWYSWRRVGEATNAAQAYGEFQRLAPDVVVMDISLPDVSGIEALRHILARDAGARVLMFSMHEEPIFATRALAAGALGYVTKASAPEVLVEAVHCVATGKRYISHDMAQTLALQSLQGDAAGGSRVAALTHREFEVMRLLVAGDTLAAIAEKLQLSYKTVANHQSAIRQKLGAQTHVQLLRIASQYGI